MKRSRLAEGLLGGGGMSLRIGGSDPGIELVYLQDSFFRPKLAV